MKNKGTKFLPGKVSEWLDCGNKDATVYTNQRILEHNKNERLVSENARIENSQIIPPCYVGDNVSIKNSVIGPHVSISRNSEISDSRISNTIVMDNVKIENKVLTNSMIGSYAECRGNAEDLSLGSYSTQA